MDNIKELESKVHLSRNSGSADTEKGKLLMQVLYQPTLDEAELLSRTALDKVNPNAFIRVYAHEIVRLCRIINKSQKLYADNWLKWHNNNENIDGVGKRIMPVDKEIDPKKWREDIVAGKTFDYSRYRNGEGNDKNKGHIFTDDEIEGVKRDIKKINGNERFKIPKEGDIPSVIWLYHYLLNRCSTIPDNRLETYGVLGRAIEAVQEVNGGVPQKVKLQ